MDKQKSKAKLSFLVFTIFIALGNSNTLYAQYFDFDFFNGSQSRSTFPVSVFGNESATIKNMHFDGDTLWVGTYKNGLIKWWEGESVKSTYWWTIQDLPGNEVYSFEKLNSRYAFFTDYNSFTNTYGGLYRLSSRFVMKEPKYGLIEKAGLDSLSPPLPKVNEITKVGDSLILLATDSGMYMFDGFGKWRKRTKENVTNITQWKIEHVTTTKSGGIYISSGNEIYRQVATNWERIDLSSPPIKLKNTYIKQLRTGPNDTVWAITTRGIVKFIDDTFKVVLNSEIKPILNEVKDVAFDGKGNPWMIFELNGGIKFLNEENGVKKWLQINSTNSILPDELSSIAVNSKGEVWLGSDNDGLFRYLSYTPGSMNNLWPENLLVYPTISNGIIYFYNSHQQLDYQVEIFGIDGKLHKQFALNQQYSTELNKGVYLITVVSHNSRFIKKVVIY